MKHHNRSKSINSCLVDIIEESVKAALQRKAVKEKERQVAMTEEDNDVEKDVKQSTVDDAEKDKLRKGDVTVDDVIEKLNSIRSGKSFKDDSVSSALGKYFDNLGVEEKTALLAFLKGISQVVTGEISASAAIGPGDKLAGIEMKKTTGSEKVSIKPNIIKAPDIEKNKKPDSEDTSGPVPIKAKK